MGGEGGNGRSRAGSGAWRGLRPRRRALLRDFLAAWLEHTAVAHATGHQLAPQEVIALGWDPPDVSEDLTDARTVLHAADCVSQYLASCVRPPLAATPPWPAATTATREW